MASRYRGQACTSTEQAPWSAAGPPAWARPPCAAWRRPAPPSPSSTATASGAGPLAEELAGAAAFVGADVTDPEQVAEAVAQAAEAAPLRIDVNCAGIGHAQRTIGRDGTPHDLQRFVRVDHRQPGRDVQHPAAGRVRHRRGPSPSTEATRGVIVNTASIAAFDGQIGQIAYAASKGGIVGHDPPGGPGPAASRHPGLHHRARAHGHAPARPAPGRAKEALAKDVVFPKRLGEPDEFARLVLAIVENPYLNGETIRLDAGLRMPPR